MSTEAAGATAADPTAPQLALQLVYLKDCSFEAPRGPRLDAAWNPKVNLDLNTTVTSLNDDVREVLLSITVTAKEGEQPAFVVDISDQWESKQRALEAYHSQLVRGREHLPAPLVEQLREDAAYWGRSIGVRYGEPFASREPIGLSQLDRLV